MLSRQHFYHRITRKLVVAFGTMFNNMKLYRYSKTGEELERVHVPLSYAGKEKYYVRPTEDPNLEKPVLITLPRMAFELNSITYDPLRKRSMFTQEVGYKGNSTVQIISAPYNFDFSLYIYVRNVEDGTQIVEQILPYFSPDYTVTVDLSTVSNLKVDVPIVLQSINQEITGDTGEPDETRTIIWTLTFTAKAQLYGPIPDENDGKLITQAMGKVYIDNNVNIYGEKELTLTTGSGTFKIGERVYEGRTIATANGTGFVRDWNATGNVLTLSEVSGIFKPGYYVYGALTNSKYEIQAGGTEDKLVANVVVVPDPSTANITDDFGFTTTITEYNIN